MNALTTIAPWLAVSVALAVGARATGAAGLIGLGMIPAVRLAFMVAGGVTNLSAALAVWTLLKSRAFGLYLGFAALTALLAGWGHAVVLAV